MLILVNFMAKVFNIDDSEICILIPKIVFNILFL